MQNKTLLFLTDSNLDNPIIHSQGLPLLEFSFTKGYQVYVMYSSRNIQIFNTELAEKILQKYSQKISFIKVKIPDKKFAPNWFPYFYYMSKALLDFIKSKKINIIHARSLFPSIVVLITKLFSKLSFSFIYDNRGVYIEEGIFLGKWKRTGFKTILLKFLELQTFKYADRIVVVSIKFKEYLVKKYGEFLIPKIEVISNKVKIQSIENSFQSQNRNLIFVYSGSAAKWQKAEGLFDIFEVITKTFPMARLVIVTYEQDAFRIFLEKRRYLMEYVDIKFENSENVQKILKQCDVGILLRDNSLINKVSCPLKFAEYLNAGLPVLISEGVGDTEEMINKYNIGTIIKRKDYSSAVKNLKLLLQETELRKRCKMVAKLEFDQQDAFKQYLNIYNALVRDE